MSLQTNLSHLVTKDDFNKAISENDKVMICCGRMGPMCVPVYETMHNLEKSGNYDEVKFYDMPFDSPDASVIRDLPECQGFMGLPFTVYFDKGVVVAATASLQSENQIKEVLDNKLLS